MTNTQKATGLQGKTVLVTGSGSGIGLATAQLAAAAGAVVIATDVKGQDETAASIRDAGGQAEAHALDVTDAGAWNAVVRDAISTHGQLYGLANVAGIVSGTDGVLTQTEDGWDQLLQVDLKGPWLGMRSVLPSMIAAGGGRIVNVASIAGLVGMPNTIAYSAAKGGVISMSRQVAVELAPGNIRVNVVAPGVTRTSMLGVVTDEFLSAVTSATPVRRVGEAEDVGNLIVYLLGVGGDFVTGQVFPVDGGWTAQELRRPDRRRCLS